METTGPSHLKEYPREPILIIGYSDPNPEPPSENEIRTPNGPMSLAGLMSDDITSIEEGASVLAWLREHVPTHGGCIVVLMAPPTSGQREPQDVERQTRTASSIIRYRFRNASVLVMPRSEAYKKAYSSGAFRTITPSEPHATPQTHAA